MLLCLSLGIPIPVSFTETDMECFKHFKVTYIHPPLGANLIAFERRFNIILSSFSESSGI